jgi:hypothetical protein
MTILQFAIKAEKTKERLTILLTCLCLDACVIIPHLY